MTDENSEMSKKFIYFLFPLLDFLLLILSGKIIRKI